MGNKMGVYLQQKRRFKEPPMSAPDYDVIIVGTGPAGLGAAFHLSEDSPPLSILMTDRERICSGGLLNDCKQNYTYPIGFAADKQMTYYLSPTLCEPAWNPDTSVETINFKNRTFLPAWKVKCN
jgi:cation diffusion facilitator CzcD-associated flavoprotein CzcO